MARHFLLLLVAALSSAVYASDVGFRDRQFLSNSAFPFANDIAHILYRARSGTSEWLAPALEQLAAVTNTSTDFQDGFIDKAYDNPFDNAGDAFFGMSAAEDPTLASLRPILRRLRWGDVKKWVRRIAKRHLYRDVAKGCADDVNMLLTRFDNETDLMDNSTSGLWASRFFDAMGKPQHNVLDGNTFWYGSHEECESIERDLESTYGTHATDNDVVPAVIPSGVSYFGGRYCLADIGTPVHVTQQMLLHGRPPGVHWGFCLPERCSTSDFTLLWRNVLDKLSTDAAYAVKASDQIDEMMTNSADDNDDDYYYKNNHHSRKHLKRHQNKLRRDESHAKPALAVNWAKCDTVGVERDMDAPAISILCIMGLFGLLALLGTGLEVYLLSSRSRAMRSSFVGKSGLQYRRLQNDDASAPALASTGDTIGAAAELSTPPPGDHPAVTVKEDGAHQLSKLNLPMWMRLIMAFSVLGSGRKILQVLSPAKKSLDTPVDSSRTTSSDTMIASLHGIRFLSMVWVILGHTYAHMGTMLSNPRVLPDVVKQFWFQIVMNASLSVDTFLLLSGLLVTFLFVSEWHNRGRRMPPWSSWLRFYVHRYLRLTPVYMLVLGLVAGVLPLLVWGPSSYMIDAWMPNRCANSWWTNALYINNILMFSEQCMSWTWYLAIDMQLYIITPLVLYPLIKFGTRVAVGILGVLMLGHLICTALITGLNDMPAHFATKQTLLEPFSLHKYFDLYYVKSWCRAGPYFIGMFTGLLLFQYRQRHAVAVDGDRTMAAGGEPVTTPALRKKYWLLVGGWIVALVCMVLPMYALWPTYLREEDFSLTVSTLYNTFARNAWAVGVAWILYMCETHRGGPINAFLKWSAFVPLSRLTYCAYLIHMPIILAVLGNTTQQMPFSHLTCLVYFAGFLFLTYAAALVLCLLLEAPLLGLEKILLSFAGGIQASRGGGKSAHGGIRGDAANVEKGDADNGYGGRRGQQRTPSPTFGTEQPPIGARVDATRAGRL